MRAVVEARLGGGDGNGRALAISTRIRPLILMRTTLVLNDDLVARVKATALQQGTTLGEITNRALRDYLRRASASAHGRSGPRIRLPSYRGQGPVTDLPPERIAELRDSDT